MLNCPSNINISQRHKNLIVKIQTGAKVFYLNLNFEFKTSMEEIESGMEGGLSSRQWQLLIYLNLNLNLDLDIQRNSA